MPSRRDVLKSAVAGALIPIAGGFAVAKETLPVYVADVRHDIPVVWITDEDGVHAVPDGYLAPIHVPAREKSWWLTTEIEVELYGETIRHHLSSTYVPAGETATVRLSPYTLVDIEGMDDTLHDQLSRDLSAMPAEDGEMARRRFDQIEQGWKDPGRWSRHSVPRKLT